MHPFNVLLICIFMSINTILTVKCAGPPVTEQSFATCKRLVDLSMEYEGDAIKAILNDVQLFTELARGDRKSLHFWNVKKPEWLLWEGIFMRRGCVCDQISDEALIDIFKQADLWSLRGIMMAGDPMETMKKAKNFFSGQQTFGFGERLASELSGAPLSFDRFVLINQIKGQLHPHLHISTQHDQFVEIKRVFGKELAHDFIYKEAGEKQLREFLASLYAAKSLEHLDETYIQVWRRIYENFKQGIAQPFYDPNMNQQEVGLLFEEAFSRLEGKKKVEIVEQQDATCSHDSSENNFNDSSYNPLTIDTLVEMVGDSIAEGGAVKDWKNCRLVSKTCHF